MKVNTVILLLLVATEERPHWMGFFGRRIQYITRSWIWVGLANGIRGR